MDVINNTTVAIDLVSFISFAGILSQRWRILFRMQIVSHEKAVTVVRGLCVLHSYLRTVQDSTYVPPGYTDTPAANGNVVEGFWRTDARRLSANENASRSANLDGLQIRELFCKYFSSEIGSVPWQLGVINRG